MVLNLKKIFFFIFLVSLSGFVNSMLIDEECYDYYSKFGIHINNLKIEACEEIPPPSFSKTEFRRLHIYVNDKNNTQIFRSSLERHQNGLLINKRTPLVILWEEMKNDTVFLKSNATIVEEFVPTLRDFSLYYDPKTNAAMVLYNHSSHFIIEGIAGDHVLRYFEKKQVYYWMKVKYPYERIPFNWKSLGAPEVENLTKNEFNLNTSLDKVNLSTTVILDNVSVNKKSPDQVIKDIIIYFNAVNMLYANFTNPKIQMVIKALVVPINVYGRQYDQYKPLKLLKNHKSYWQDPQIILNMVITPFCNNGNSTSCLNHSDTTSFRLYCGRSDITIRSPAIFQVRHMDFHGGYEKTAQMIALALNASLLDYNDTCIGIMARYLDPPDLPRSWSRCTINKLSNYFKSVNEDCFRDTTMIKV